MEEISLEAYLRDEMFFEFDLMSNIVCHKSQHLQYGRKFSLINFSQGKLARVSEPFV